MDKIVVPTRFNKTGKRVLRTPLDAKRIYAPAEQKYQPIFRAIEDEWWRKLNYARRAYAERVADWMASYVARDSTPAAERYRVVKFLAEEALAEHGPMEVKGPMAWKRWSCQIGEIPGLPRLEEESWEAYIGTCCRYDEEMGMVRAKAYDDYQDMKRALWREIINI